MPTPFNRGSHHAAALSWADGDTAWTDANCGVGVIPATVPTIIGGVVDMQPGLHIDLGHLDALGLGRSGERGQSSAPLPPRQKRFSSWGVLLGMFEAMTANMIEL